MPLNKQTSKQANKQFLLTESEHFFTLTRNIFQKPHFFIYFLNMDFHTPILLIDINYLFC